MESSPWHSPRHRGEKVEAEYQVLTHLHENEQTFKELLNKVVFDDVWVTLQKEYSMKNEAFEAYFKVFNQLKRLTPKPNHDKTCFMG
jgi:hypothetical protein